jgi:RNA polymerase sigma-70 factor (ECF subfamily)
MCRKENAMRVVEPFLARSRDAMEARGARTAHRIDERDVLVALLDAVAAGDELALATLHRRSAARLRAIAHRILRDHARAEEAVQDAFMQVWNHAADYSPAVAAPMTWMASIARNRALDLLRHDNRERAHRAEPDADFDYDELAGDAPDPEQSLALDGELRALRAAFDDLGEMERRALELAFVREMSNVEVAAALGAPLGTVKSWIRRGLARVRALKASEDARGRHAPEPEARRNRTGAVHAPRA